ncbi:MAG: transposase [Caldimonas sp.]
MPVRSLSAGSFFDPEFVCPGVLKFGTMPWVLARSRSSWFPGWLFADWRGQGRRGRDAWPAVVLVTLVLLRASEQGMSRRAAVRRGSSDVVWRAAMGLSLGTSTPSERTLRDFERFLQRRHVQTQTPRYLLLHEHIVRACMKSGVFDSTKAAWAMDSTPMWCYGATRDTVRLLGDGLRMLAGAWGRATRCSLTAIAEKWQMPFLVAKSTKGAFDNDWSNDTATGQVITQLAQYVVRVATLVRREVTSIRPSLRKGLLRKCRHLVRVVSDDLETNSQGQLVIAERVAADRIVSITDPEARHGRKSKSQTFKGFKVHLLGEVVSGLIASVAVTKGNMHDGAPAQRLLRRAKDLCAEITQVLADTAYGGARLRHIAQGACGVNLIAPPPPVNGKAGKLGKGDTILDREARTVTCANGVVTDDIRFVWSSEHGVHVPRVAWPKSACDACPLSAQCRGKDTGGRRMLLHPYEDELRAAREAWSDPATRKTYRTRSQCERLVNQMTRYGGRQARAFGLKQAQMQAHAIAAASNLRLLARALVARSRQSPTAARAAA